MVVAKGGRMKKALICYRKESIVVAQAMKIVIELIEFESDICQHEDALATFLSGVYSHVVILDYSERGDKSVGGFASYRDIKASAMPDQKMIRAGYDKLDYSDYWLLPGELAQLFKLLTKEDYTGS